MDTEKLDINVSCTWGDGPDVLVTLASKPFVLYEDPKNDPPPRGQWAHGYVTKGAMDLTRNEALDLAQLLFRAAGQAKEMDDSYADYAEHGQAIHNAEVENMSAEAAKLHTHLRKKLLPKDTQDVITKLRTGKL